MEHSKNRKVFYKEIFKRNNGIGAVAPSSRHLTKKILSKIENQSSPITIVELGPGTGVFTRALANSLRENDQLFSVELNPEFSEKLALEFNNTTNITILTGSAFELNTIIQEQGLEKVDYIISSLPLSLFEKEDVEGLIKLFKRLLKPSGSYIQFQYSLSLKKIMYQVFEEKVEIDFTPLNIPPAFIYKCIN